MHEREYDIVIVGSGAGGGAAAKELAPLCSEGARIAVLEWGAKLGEEEFTGREVDMAGKLAQSSDFRDCATEQWFTFALGRLPDEVADECSLLQASDVVAESGDIRDLLVAIVVSDAFRYRVVDGGEG